MTTEVGKTEMVNKSVNKSVINKRKRVIICGDSMVNGIDSDGTSSKSFSTVVKPFGGASLPDMKDYIKPALKTKPDKMIVHVGTNDLTKGIQNTTENLSDIVECARELSPETQLYISAVCIRKDIPSHFKKVSDLNKSIKSFCQTRNIAFIEHSNIDNSCLARKKLHLNPKGIGRLAVNFKSFLEKHWIDTLIGNDSEVDCHEKMTILKEKCPTNLVLGYLNINSIRNKFKNLETFIDGKVDILAIAETKLDESFTNNKFSMLGYKKPLRLDCSKTSGGI